LVTGAAGFIGSHLVETLLKLGQQVVGLDNFATGSRRNLESVREAVRAGCWRSFLFLESDIRELDACRSACEGVDYVLHQAALGSVPRSIKQPLDTHEANISGSLNIQLAARDVGVKAFVYASSSAVYGDQADLPKREPCIGRALSPYALTKRVNELYAEVFVRCYGSSSVGLRYFNVFGPRQDPAGPYAAVIPKWIAALVRGEQICINGDGETSRDFCYVANAVQANLLAAALLAEKHGPGNEPDSYIFNVAGGGRTTLNELFKLLRQGVASRFPSVAEAEPDHGPFREGDIRHSQADLTQVCRLLGYEPSHNVLEGLQESLAWYLANLSAGH
jgi:UDP-N-acetylglucosamine 4-epimerase